MERAMRCAAIWVHHGPSIHSRRPVIRYTLEVSGGPDLPFLTGQLSGLLPGLRLRRTPCDIEAVPHLFEHVCIELQNLTGDELACVRAQGPRVAPDVAVVPFEDERVALEAGTLALALISSFLSNRPARFEPRLQEFLQFAERQRLPVQDLAMVSAARTRDMPVLRIAGRLIQLGHGCHQQRLNGSETTHTNIVSNDLASNKDYARRILRAVGLPVPKYERAYRKADAVAAAERIGFPVVVKPNGGNMGAGVSVGMKTAREVGEAFDRTRGLGRSVLVEEFVPGADYRMLVIDGKLEAAARRVPAHVVGDGLHTIEDLVRRANEDPRRGAGQISSWTRLEFDEQSDRLLAELGYERDSVVPDGAIVYLKRIANTSAGGTAVDVTDQVHPENREIAERAAMAIGLDVAGVDLLVKDIAQPMRAQGGVVCEINSRPGLRKHLWPAEGRPRDVTGRIVEMLFPPGSPSRIPIGVVTGLGDTKGVARMLADVLATEGTTVGLASPDGVFIDGKRADGGGMEGSLATRMLLLDPAVELAVIELPPSEALRYGLGYDWADACAVLDGGAIASPELLDAVNLVVASARSHLVLSAEDEKTYDSKHPEARVWRVSSESRDTAALFAKALALCLGRQPADVERRLSSLAHDLVQPRGSR
jgi:cyanophycin synthetase